MDPFAGSYAVESMTDDIEAAAAELMARIAEMGGAVAAIEQGFQKSEIERSAYEVAQQIDEGERVVVGVNKFTADDEEPYEPLRVDPAHRAGPGGPAGASCGPPRPAGACPSTSTRSRRPRKARITSCRRSGTRSAPATLGEVCDALRAVWGVYQPPDVP